MSTGGSFKLISNDGKQDDMIMATRLLNDRLGRITDVRKLDPRIRDVTPTLVDIEKTHLLFVYAQFKPYVAIANEYQITQAPKTQLGSQVIFNIPLYGDFIHDMVIHMTLSSVTAANTTNANKFLKYCDYPGERICKTTQISVNGNVLDEYSSDVYPFYRNFQVSTGKTTGYNRMMGQQENITVDGTVQSGRGGSQQKSTLVNGPQTPQSVQGALDLWVPVLFWYSLDVKLSIISVSIPHGQRYLTLQLASAADLLQYVGTYSGDDAPSSNPVPVPDVSTCELYTNNIFVNPEIHSIIIKRIGFNLIRVFRQHRVTVSNATDSVLLSQFKWPIETIYCGIRPRSNFDNNNALMPSSWHKYGAQALNSVESGEMDANAWKIGTALANDPGQAADYTASVTRLDGKASGLNFATALGVAGVTVLSVTQINTVLQRGGYKPLVGTFAAPATPTNLEVTAALPNGSKVVSYYSNQPAIDSLGIQAHGIDLFKSYPAKFYNAYLPFHYGGEHIRTPEDSGKFMLPFNLYPGSYQPSGHINVSRAREFYFNYNSSVVSNSNPGELFLIGIAINFLLISDGSAVLRYST